MLQPILLVGNFLSGSVGIPGVCEDLAARLGAAGWQVLTTSAQPGRLARILDMVSTAWRKRNEYRAAQVEVYSGAAFLWAEVVCAVLRRAQKPYVLTLHGGNLPVFAQGWPRRVRRLLRSAFAVTTPSRYLYEHMLSYHSDLRLLPNALDVSAYEFHQRRHPRPCFVWLRAFHSIYNPSLGPQVVACLVPRFPDVRLTMVGPDKGDGSLQETRRVAAELGVADLLTFPGRVPKSEVPTWLNRGDLFLNTTNVDNTPISALEAMACGLCVVSTNVGGVPYLLDDQHDALLVPPNDPQAMAIAAIRLFAEPDLAGRLSTNARKKTEQFDWSVILPQWERLFNEAAALMDS